MALRVLVAYGAFGNRVSTQTEYLDALKNYTGFDVSYIHVTHGASIEVDPLDFDVVIQNYCARYAFAGYVSESFKEWLKGFEGLKVLIAQDEYEETNLIREAIRELGFHVILTCVPLDQIDYVYPRAELPNVRFVRVLTGYAPCEDTIKVEPAPLSERPILIGYRARALPARFGRLGHEKLEIGRKMKQVCEARGLKHDIAMDDASRIYGNDWFKFLASCRSVLGTESGSNVFDFDGSLMKAYKRLEEEKGSILEFHEFEPYIREKDSQIQMGQVSPRIFEAALMRTPLVLFPGRYSDIIDPYKHYIPLEKDFSNVDEVISLLDDISALEEMAERTYSDLIASKRYSYESFGQTIRNVVEESFRQLQKPIGGKNAKEKTATPWSLSGDYVERPTRVIRDPKHYELITTLLYNQKHRIELRRLIDIYADLLQHVTLWAVRTARTYAEIRKSLSAQQIANPKIASLPQDLAYSALIELGADALADIREKFSTLLEGNDDHEPGKEAEAAAIEKQRSIELQEAIRDISEFIRVLQEGFNNFWSSSQLYFEIMQSVPRNENTLVHDLINRLGLMPFYEAGIIGMLRLKKKFQSF